MTARGVALGALLGLFWVGGARAQPVLGQQVWAAPLQQSAPPPPPLVVQPACPVSGTSFLVPLMFTYRRLDYGGEACRERGALSGVHIAFWNSTNGGFLGAQFGVVNANAMDDSQLVGLQLGVLNVGGGVHGAQLGAINVASRMKGLQLGLINVAQRLDGVQIGALNIATSHRPVPFMILVNVGFADL